MYKYHSSPNEFWPLKLQSSTALKNSPIVTITLDPRKPDPPQVPMSTRSSLARLLEKDDLNDINFSIMIDLNLL